MNPKSVLSVTALILIISASSLQVSFAQSANASSAFVAPVQGDIRYADSMGKCRVGFSTSGQHFVEFFGPIYGTVTWSGSITALKGSNLVVPWDPTTIETDKPSDGGSATLSLPAGERMKKSINCYATALYQLSSGTSSLAGKGKATVSYSIPGVTTPPLQPGEVTFTVRRAP